MLKRVYALVSEPLLNLLIERDTQAHHAGMSQPQPECDLDLDEVEDWRRLQDVLEERDREWWADAQEDDEPGK